MDAERFSVEGSSFDAGLTLCPEDVAVFLDGDIDEALLENLTFGFLCIEWRRAASREDIVRIRSRWSRPLSDRPVSRPWALLKLLFSASTLSTPTGEQLSLRSEPAIVPLLCAGRVGEACRIAQRRLFVSGLNPLRVGFPDSSDGTRIAAALLFPVQITRLLRWSLAETGGEDVRTT
jgi:CRISPR-associated protein Csx17